MDSSGIRIDPTVHDPIVRLVISRYVSRSHRDYDDIYQSCMVKLLVSLPKYDPARGEVGSYVVCACDSAVRDFLRASVQGCRDYRRTRPMPLPGDADEPAADTGEVGGAMLARDVWDYAMREADDDERVMLRMRFAEGRTTREAGRALGIDRSWVTVRTQRLCAKIRQTVEAG